MNKSLYGILTSPQFLDDKYSNIQIQVVKKVESDKKDNTPRYLINLINGWKNIIERMVVSSEEILQVTRDKLAYMYKLGQSVELEFITKQDPTRQRFLVDRAVTQKIKQCEELRFQVVSDLKSYITKSLLLGNKVIPIEDIGVVEVRLDGIANIVSNKPIELVNESINKMLDSHLFYMCNVKSIYLANTKITQGKALFTHYETLKHVDFTGCNTSDMTDTSFMFCNCENLETVNLTDLNTSKVTAMVKMFSGCSRLKQLDISKLDLSNVTDMSRAFASCEKLEHIDIGRKDLRKVKSFKGLFYWCHKLEAVDLSGIVLRDLVKCWNMFRTNTSLKVLDLTCLDGALNLSNPGLEDLVAHCDNLELLIVNNKNITKDVLNLLEHSSDYYKKLKHTKIVLNNIVIKEVTQDE